MSQGAKDGGVTMSKDGRAENCSCVSGTSYIHVGRQIIAPCIICTSYIHVGRCGKEAGMDKEFLTKT